MRLLLPLLLFMIAGGLFFGLTSSLFVTIDGLRLEQQRVENDLASAKELSARFNVLSEQANTIKKTDLALLESLVPKTVDTVDLLVKINGVAKSSAMLLSDVKIKTEEAKTNSTSINTVPGLGTVTFNFSVLGSYGALKQFLANLERSLRLVDVTVINFNVADQDPNQYNIELKTYWIK